MDENTGQSAQAIHLGRGARRVGRPPTYPNRKAALAFAAGIEILEVTDEVLRLALALITAKVMPGPLEGDAVHVATAIYYGVEYLLSWNVRHLANPNKRTHLSKVCRTLGKAPPMIITPDVLWEEESDEPKEP